MDKQEYDLLDIANRSIKIADHYKEENKLLKQNLKEIAPITVMSFFLWIIFTLIVIAIMTLT